MMRERGTPEPGVDFAGDGAAADDLATLEDERLQSGLCEVKGSNETIVPTANDDDAIGVRRQEAYLVSERIFIAALRPGAPMIPPPG
jgi:hypothetical protein